MIKVFRRTFLSFSIVIASLSSFACSAFFSNSGAMLFGKNFDWSSGIGYIIKNNRGQQKYAYGLGGNKQAKWVSQYGSLTFNQIGKEFPYGGINEKGLIVEQLWLNSSYYQSNSNETISELEWIQYQLDNFNSVAEVLRSINSLTIKPISARLHYFIADASGNSAVIDFIEGEAVIHSRTSAVQVLTNSNYKDAEQYFLKYGSMVNASSRTSEDRFCQMNNNLSRSNLKDYRDGFNVLQQSSEDRENYKTYWTIVYDLKNLEIYYKSYNNKNVKRVKLSDFKFDSHEAVLACDINKDTTEFVKYLAPMNDKLVMTSLSMMNIKLDAKLAAQHQMHPENMSVDTIYGEYYAELKINFNIKQPQGLLYYTLMQGGRNFKRRAGVAAAVSTVNKKEIKTVFYAVPKGEYALASFHDVNSNGKLDIGLFGIPKEPYAFSNNAKGWFGLPPKYKRAVFTLRQDAQINIKIK